MPRALASLLAGVGLASTGCTDASARDSSQWLRLVRDSGYEISMDTSRLFVRQYPVFEVWFRTDHAQTRYYKGTPFTRETVQEFLNCGRMSYKTESVALSMGARRPALRQQDDANDLRRQEWHQVEAGTVDAAVGRAACEVARQRAALAIMRR